MAAEARPPLVLAVDVGTSSVRAAVYDSRGSSLKGVNGRRSLSEGAPETNPDAVLAKVFECLDEILSHPDISREDLGAFALSTFASSLLGVDPSGQAVTEMLTYADTRSEAEADALREELDEAETHERTGCRFHPAYWPAQLRWFQKNDPTLFARVHRWMGLGEYIEEKLFGESRVSLSATSWTGLLDRHRLDWDRALLAALPIEVEKLPSLDKTGWQQGELRMEFAERWPSLRKSKFFRAVGDGAAANIGSGCVDSSRVALTIGTTSAMRVVLADNPENLPGGLWCYRVDAARSLLGGALSEGGNLYAWAMQNLDLGEPDRVEESLRAMPPDQHGLTVLPFLAGERSPGWASTARATIHGISARTSGVDILRACLEAVAYRIGLVCQQMKTFLSADPVVVASGGSLQHSPAWLQILADVLDRPVRLSGAREASARGAALLALESMGVIADISRIPEATLGEYLPDPERHAIYRKALERHQDLYRALIGPPA
jgi:gluconokinase